jgi:hypothetical protein
MYDGNLDGSLDGLSEGNAIDKANSECQNLASNASLAEGRVFKAWLSTSSYQPKDSFTDCSVGYYLVDGTRSPIILKIS